MSAREAADLCIRLYRRLARGFPEEFGRAYGMEIARDSEEMIRDAALRRGWAGLVPLTCRILLDLVVRLAAEHTSELSMNIKHSARMLIHSPGFTLVSVVSLGFGISLATTVFSEFYSTIFQPVPAIADPQSLVTTLVPVSFPYYEEYRDGSGQFSMLAAYAAPVPFVLRAGQGPERIWGHVVTPNYFSVLGAKCQSGRLLGVEDRDGNSNTVISDRLWRTRFGADISVVGRTVRVNGQPVTVVGVAAPDFLGASPMLASADLWIATTAAPILAPELDRARLSNPKIPSFKILGKLSPGVIREQAEAALDVLTRQLDERNGEKDRSKGRKFALLPGGNLSPLRKQDLTMMTAFPFALVGITLWVAYANVGTMLLARAASRRREISIRLALGASRSRIVRQLLTESVLLSLAGAVLGYVLTFWWLSGYDRMIKPVIPNYVNVVLKMDWVTFVFTSAVAVAAGILFGLAPALYAARGEIAAEMRTGINARLTGYRWFSTRNLLVLQQVAGSLTLLMLTGFIVIGFQRNTNVDIGFDPKGLYTMSVDPGRDGYSPERSMALLTEVRRRVDGIPGVRSTAISQGSPVGMLSGEAVNATVRKPGTDTPSIESVRIQRVGPGLFESLGIPLLAGRGFRDEDRKSTLPVVVVNETLARSFGAGTEALGRLVEMKGKTYQVVGVAKDVRPGFVLRAAVKGVYLPLAASDYSSTQADGMTLVVRAEPGVDAPAAVRQILWSMDPTLALFDVSAVTDRVQQMLYMVKETSYLYGGIGIFGLILASIGLGGVTAYAVAQRRKEIGIRMALGAQAGDVLRLVLREGVWLVAFGTVLGMLAASGLARVLSSFLEPLADAMKTSYSEPILVIGAPVLLAALTLLSCWIPARRSTKVDPVLTLREE